MQGRAGLLIRHSLLDLSIGGFPSCSFVGICLAQGSESSSHILIRVFHTLVNGIDAGYQVVVHLLDHLVLSRIGAQPGSRFLCQGSIQLGHVVADGVGCFHDSSILNRCIRFAHILISRLSFQIFFHTGNPVIQSLIAGLDFIMDSIGFVRDAFIQFVISSFAGRLFSCICFSAGLGLVGIRLIQCGEPVSHVLVDRIDALYQVVIDLLDYLVLSRICTDTSCRFIIQSLAKGCHILANLLVCLHNPGILDFQLAGQSGLTYIIIFSFILQVFFHTRNPSIQCCIRSFALGRFSGKL